ncbi:AGAP008858PAlike, partial [Caligus rogercresseyi]
TQLDFQVKLLGASDATYSPCIGMILSTYGPKSSPPPQPLPTGGAQEYGKPMSLSYNLVSDPCLSSEVLDVINALTSPQNGIQIPLQAPLPGGKDSHLLRLGASLVPKFPRDQDERLWRYIRRRVLAPEFRDMEDPLLHYHQGLFAKGLEPEEDEIDDDEENALKNNDKGPLNTSIFPIKPPTAFPLDFSAKRIIESFLDA